MRNASNAEYEVRSAESYESACLKFDMTLPMKRHYQDPTGFGVVPDARLRAYEHYYHRYILQRVASRRNELLGLRGLRYFVRRWQIELWAWRGVHRAATRVLKSRSEV